MLIIYWLPFFNSCFLFVLFFLFFAYLQMFFLTLKLLDFNFFLKTLNYFCNWVFKVHILKKLFLMMRSALLGASSWYLFRKRLENKFVPSGFLVFEISFIFFQKFQIRFILFYWPCTRSKIKLFYFLEVIKLNFKILSFCNPKFRFFTLRCIFSLLLFGYSFWFNTLLIFLLVLI